jgi:DNA-nicking Smr family endonuclease
MTARRRKRRGPRAPTFGAPDPLLDARPEATLDLHGDTALEAERRTHDFIVTHSRIAPGTIVHVITGRGKGSSGRPVLPGVVRRVLTGTASRFVSAFDQDLDGGGYLIRLR